MLTLDMWKCAFKKAATNIQYYKQIVSQLLLSIVHIKAVLPKVMQTGVSVFKANYFLVLENRKERESVKAEDRLVDLCSQI